MSKWNNGYSVSDLRSKLYENVKNENGGFLNNNVRYARNIEDTTKLQQELQRKDNNWNELEKWLKIQMNTTTTDISLEYKGVLDKIEELENGRSDE